MRSRMIPLDGSTPGTRRVLSMLHFGRLGARPKCYLQTGLHADEIPGMLVLHHLRILLAALEAEGRIAGEVVLVPAANPLGLAQQVSGSHVGRFWLPDGSNFNRHFPALFEPVRALVAGRLDADPAANVARVRSALRVALEALPIVTERDSLQHALLREALDADVVLDLHCDTEAVMHVYTGTPLVDQGIPLARLLGAQAMLFAEVSGDDPFDEACSRPWWELADHFAGHPLPSGCFAATVELRGATDVSHRMAAADAQALVRFLTLREAISGERPELPPLACDVTPLRGSEPIVAPSAGVVVFHRAAGERVVAGDPIVDLIDPLDQAVLTLSAPTAGVLYARCASRWASPGMRLAKVAGSHATRSGRLLSP